MAESIEETGLTIHVAAIVVRGVQVDLVDALIKRAGPIFVNRDLSWKLSSRNRPAAYARLYQEIVSYLSEQQIEQVLFRGVDVFRSMTKSHLEAAELRGVILAAIAAHGPMFSLVPSEVEKMLDQGKLHDVIDDDAFWRSAATGAAVRKRSREAAALLVAAQRAYGPK